MNPTPTAYRPLVTLITRGLSGVETLGAVLNVSHNVANVVATDLYDLAGRLADPTATPPIAAIEGKQPQYLEKRKQHAFARAVLRTAVDDGRAFVEKAIDSLKVPLGRRWNSEWEAAGFTGGSIAINRKDPIPTLMALSAFYQTNPGREVAAENLTAIKADQLKSAIVTAQGAADEAKTTEKAAKQARDAALVRLKERVTSLRKELETLLEPDDARWYRFGFRRPVDGATPDLIDDLSLMAAGTGRITAEWSRARLAVNYRVSWKLKDSMEEPTEVGLFSDEQAIVSDLPSDQTVTIIVTARNSSGESAPVEADIVVP